MSAPAISFASNQSALEPPLPENLLIQDISPLLSMFAPAASYASNHSEAQSELWTTSHGGNAPETELVQEELADANVTGETGDWSRVLSYTLLFGSVSMWSNWQQSTAIAEEMLPQKTVKTSWKESARRHLELTYAPGISSSWKESAGAAEIRMARITS